MDSVACTLQTSQMQLDLSSLLISLGLVQYKIHLHDKTEPSSVDTFQLEKRLRKKSDDAIQKESSQLVTFDDFKDFYDSNKSVKTHDKTKINIPNDDDNQQFEVFKAPSRRDPFNDAEPSEIQIPNVANPMVKCITEHFTLMHVEKLEFYCRPMYIVDPLTILIEVDDMTPPKINRIEQNAKYFPLEGLIS